MTTTALDEVEPAADEPTTSSTLSRRPGWGAVLVTILVVALLALSVERGLAWKSDRDSAERRQAAIDAASAEVVGLITINAKTSDADIDKLLAGATAAFRDQLESQADTLRSALAENDVQATGEVVSAGLTTFDDGKATVIVAAKGTVDNKQTGDPAPRNYRLEVTLTEQGNRWLVSGLEFVA